MLAITVTVTGASVVKPKPDQITLPAKYTPILYEHLTGRQHEQCDRYVNELKLIEMRKRLGAQPWELNKMKTRADIIDKNYDRYCLKLMPATN